MKFIKYFLPALILVNSAINNSLAQEKKPMVVASINPVYQIILAITQDKNNTILIINSAVSEHNPQLKKSDVESFSKADLIFYVDDNLEKNFAKSVKNLKLQKKSYELSTINNIKLLKQQDDSKKTDLHLWLNPKNGIVIAEFVTKKLSEIDQKNSKKYQKNLEKFKAEIFKTEKNIKDQMAAIKKSDYVFYHGGYQYFEDYFALKKAKIISHENDLELSIKEARAFDSLAKSTKIKCLFGEIFDEKNSALKLAQNYKIKFMALDLVGTKENLNAKQNGYATLFLNLAGDMNACLR